MSNQTQTRTDVATQPIVVLGDGELSLQSSLSFAFDPSSYCKCFCIAPPPSSRGFAETRMSTFLNSSSAGEKLVSFLLNNTKKGRPAIKTEEEAIRVCKALLRHE